MKKFLLLSIVTTLLILVGCGTSKQPVAQTSKNPFSGGTVQAPCEMLEKNFPGYIVGMGSARCTENTYSTARAAALTNAQREAAAKMKAHFQGVITSYFSNISQDKGTANEQTARGYSDRIIDNVLNRTEAECVQNGEIRSDGYFSVFIGIKASLKDTEDAVVKGLSENDQTRVKFNEKVYREEAEKKFKEYKEQQAK